MNRLLPSLALAGLLAACRGGDPPPPASPEAPATPQEPGAEGSAPAWVMDAVQAASPVGPVSPDPPPQRRAADDFTYDTLQFAFDATVEAPITRAAPTDPEALRAWQEDSRQRLVDLLAIHRDRAPTTDAQVIGERTLGEDVRALELAYELEPGLLTRAWYLVPPGEGPFPAVVFFHGHDGLGHDASVGVEPALPDNPHDGGALALAEAGYAVLAPTTRSFVAGDDSAARHQHFVRLATLTGRTALGVFVEDAMRAVDILSRRVDVDEEHIGAAGLSLGGLLSLFTLALDERVDAAVSAGFLGSYRGDLARQAHCPCQYSGGLGHEFDVSDLVAMAAPKPVRFVIGERDPAMPIDTVRDAFESVVASYSAFDGVAAAASLVEHEGGHVWVSEPAIEWLDGHLRAD